MNIRKILAMTLSVMMILTMAVIPAMADDSEFNLAFIGVGSKGIAYDDLTLPATTIDGDEITWSTTTGDVIAIEDKEENGEIVKIAKILKQKAGATIDANVVATVNGIDNTIAFKVGYIWAEKTSRHTQNFSADTIPNTITQKSGGTASIENGEFKMTKANDGTTKTTDVRFNANLSSSSNNNRMISFDFKYESTISKITFRFSYSGTSAPPAELEFHGSGMIKVRNGNGDNTMKECGYFNAISTDGVVTTYGGNIIIALNKLTSTYDVLLDGNLIANDFAFRSADNYKYAGQFRAWVENISAYGSYYFDNIEISEQTYAFDGLTQETINPVEEGGDASVYSGELTLPATNTAEDAVTWTAGNNMDVSENVATATASYFEDRNAVVTANIAKNNKSYSKDYTFSVAKAVFPAEKTFTVEGTKAAGDTLTAKIEGINPVADGNLTVIMAIYNDVGGVKSLADVKATTQAVTADGELSVEIEDLADGVKADSEVKMFVFDGMGTLKPFTTATQAE